MLASRKARIASTGGGGSLGCGGRVNVQIHQPKAMSAQDPCKLLKRDTLETMPSSQLIAVWLIARTEYPIAMRRSRSGQMRPKNADTNDSVMNVNNHDAIVRVGILRPHLAGSRTAHSDWIFGPCNQPYGD